MTDLQLPAVLAKGDKQRIAHTASDYWSFVYNGFEPTGESPDDEETNEPSPAEVDPDLPAPVEVVQRPRRGRQQEAQQTSNDGDGQTDTQGTAAGESGGDLTASPNA